MKTNKKRGRPPGTKNKNSTQVVINKNETVEISKIKKKETVDVLRTAEEVCLVDNNIPDDDGVIIFGKSKNVGIVYDKYCVIVKQKKLNKKSGEFYWVDAPSPFQRDLEGAIRRIAEIYKRDKLKNSSDFHELISKYKEVHAEFLSDLDEFTSLFKGVRRAVKVSDE